MNEGLRKGVLGPESFLLIHSLGTCDLTVKSGCLRICSFQIFLISQEFELVAKRKKQRWKRPHLQGVRMIHPGDQTTRPHIQLCVYIWGMCVCVKNPL